MKRASIICMTLAILLLALVPWTLRAETKQAAETKQKDTIAEQEKNSEAQKKKKLSFETVDIFGNPVSSEDLFGEHQVTMLNIWTSWCGPCLRELPELEALNQEFAEKDCAIVGLLYDGVDEAAIQEAKEILNETGVTYTVILPWEGITDVFAIQAVPTSIFVDQEGNVVGDPVVGALIESYNAGVDAALGSTE